MYDKNKNNNSIYNNFPTLNMIEKAETSLCELSIVLLFKTKNDRIPTLKEKHLVSISIFVIVKWIKTSLSTCVLHSPNLQNLSRYTVE